MGRRAELFFVRHGGHRTAWCSYLEMRYLEKQKVRKGKNGNYELGLELIAYQETVAKIKRLYF